MLSLSERERPLKFLAPDNDGKFTLAFDRVFNAEGVRVIHTPVRAANATPNGVGSTPTRYTTRSIATTHHQVYRLLYSTVLDEPGSVPPDGLSRD